MSEIHPLKVEINDDFARELLESASADRSMPGACQRALGALGLGAGVVVATGSAAGASTASIGGGAATAATAVAGGSLAPAGLAAKVSALAVAKWLGLGILGGAMTLGAAEYVVIRRDTAQRHAESSTSGPDAPAALAAQAAPAEGREIRTNDRDTTGAAEVAEARAPSDEAPAPSRIDALRRPSDVPGKEPQRVNGTASNEIKAVPEETGTMAQLGALRATRLALASHDPSRALVLLNDFDRHYPSSPLGEEVTVLRIDALADLGRRSEAIALGTAFLKANPQSAYGQRVRSKLKLP